MGQDYGRKKGQNIINQNMFQTLGLHHPPLLRQVLCWRIAVFVLVRATCIPIFEQESSRQTVSQLGVLLRYNLIILSHSLEFAIVTSPFK